MKDKTFTKYKQYIVHFAKKTYGCLRKRKYSFDYYIKNFIHILNDVTKWENLCLINTNAKKFHWKSIYNEYLKWSNDGIFELAYKQFLTEHYFKMSRLVNNTNINLFIDVTKINNKYGSEKVAINVEYKKKNVTSLSVICDSNKIPLGFQYVDINVRPGKKNSFKHEIKNVQNTLDTIPINFDDHNVNIMGDKGYVCKDKYKLGKLNLPLICPKKKNQKTKNTTEEILLLRKRHKIENLFASLKNTNRINVRKDKKIGTFMSFVYLGFLEYLFKYNDTHENILVQIPS